MTDAKFYFNQLMVTLIFGIGPCGAPASHCRYRPYNPILPGEGGGGIAPLMFFFHHPETAQAMKLKLSDFKDTCLRHIKQVIPGCYILRCYHGNKITKGTLQNLTQ